MNAPYETASTEMFDAHHGQNSPEGEPLRSDSSMTLMPFASMAPGAVGALRVDDSSMAVMAFPFSRGPRAAGPSVWPYAPRRPPPRSGRCPSPDPRRP